MVKIFVADIAQEFYEGLGSRANVILETFQKEFPEREVIGTQLVTIFLSEVYEFIKYQLWITWKPKLRK